MDLGSWSSWAAVLLASIAGGLAWSAKRREDRRDKRQRDRDRQEQAQEVAGWVDRNPPGERTYKETSWALRVANRSKLPIFDVDIAAVMYSNNERFKATEPTTFPIIPPDESEYVRPTNPLADMSGSVLHVAVLITFTDCAGARWHRDEHGRLYDIAAISSGSAT